MSIHTLQISTLSPIHVGCDEVYEPSNFVIHQGVLHALDIAALAEDLSLAEQRQLATLSECREPIGALQRFFRDRAERFSALAQHQISVADAIVHDYEQNAGKPTQRSANGEATYNVFPISRTAYRPVDNTPYLPGSSLKGSIRTAWLNKLNRNSPLASDEKRDKKGAPRHLQERLLGYTAGKFENDPFRHVGLADAHPDADSSPPPTRVLYAISKKKRLAREGERGASELKMFLETIPEALPASFIGELRLTGSINWGDLCDACNNFYRPQLEAELNHANLGHLIDSEWKNLLGNLLGNELDELIKAKQGFLLRVGRHSGAESVTLEGLRDIKILGPRVDGKQTFDYRNATTEKRFASLNKAGDKNLLPFGWLWINACNAQHRHHADSLQQKLAHRSTPLRQAHQDRHLRLEEMQQKRAVAQQIATQEKEAIQAAAHAANEAEAQRLATLANLSANARRIEEFKATFAARTEQLRGNKDKQNTDYHSRARKLAQDALEGADWTPEEKHAAADAITEWLPKVIEKIDKDALKKLKLASLRSQ